MTNNRQVQIAIHNMCSSHGALTRPGTVLEPCGLLLYIGCAFLMAFSSLFGCIRACSELLYWLRRKVGRCQCAVAPWVSVSHVDFGGGGLQLCVEPAALLGLHGTQVWIKFSHGSKIDNRPVVCVCEIGAYLLLPCWNN